MHDRHAVVCCVENLAIRASLVLCWVDDVVKVNLDVVIPIWAILGVMVAKAVQKLMGDVATILPVAWSQKSPSDQSDSLRRKDNLKESNSHTFPLTSLGQNPHKIPKSKGSHDSQAAGWDCCRTGYLEGKLVQIQGNGFPPSRE